MLRSGLTALVTQLVPGTFLAGALWLWLGDSVQNNFNYSQSSLAGWLLVVVLSAVLGYLLSSILDFFEASVLPRRKWWRALTTKEDGDNVWNLYVPHRGPKNRRVNRTILFYRFHCRNGIALLVLAIAWFTTSDNKLIPFAVLTVSLVCLAAAMRTQRLLGKPHH